MTTRTPAIRQTVGEARPGGVTEVPVIAVPERTVADVLLGAARVIEEFGWWQDGTPAAPLGFCASNAISRVARDENTALTDLNLAAQDRLVVFLGGESGSSLSTIFDWNDAPDRTRDDVLRALRAAANGSAS